MAAVCDRARAAAIERGNNILFDFAALEDNTSDDGSEPDCGLAGSRDSEDESIIGQD